MEEPELRVDAEHESEGQGTLTSIGLETGSISGSS